MSKNEYPIIFSTEMARAILKGEKSQTRRIINPQPIYHPEWGTMGFEWKDKAFTISEFKQKMLDYSPYGKTEDILWVRETFCRIDNTEFGGDIWYDYKASPKYAEPGVSHPAGWENAPDDPDALCWKPSIHMPRTAARLFLRIKEINIERLQNISSNDAINEGIKSIFYMADGLSWCNYLHKDKKTGKYYTDFEDPIDSFHSLWDSINEKRGFGWNTNPWVWVVKFERIEDVKK